MNNENFNINFFKSEYSESSQDTSLKRPSDKTNSRLSFLAHSIKTTLSEMNNLISKNCDQIEKKRPDMNRRKIFFGVEKKVEDLERSYLIKDDIFYEYVYPNSYDFNNDPFSLQVQETDSRELFGEEVRSQLQNSISRIQKIDEAVCYDPTLFEDIANLSFSSTGI